MLNSLHSKSFNKFWRYFDQYFNKSRGQSRHVDSASEPQSTCDLFANKFSVIYEGRSDSFSDKAYNNFVADYAEFLPMSKDNVPFDENYMSFTVIANCIDKFTLGKAPGCDSIDVEQISMLTVTQ